MTKKITIEAAGELSFDELKKYAKKFDVTGKSKNSIINELDIKDAFLETEEDTTTATATATEAPAESGNSGSPAPATDDKAAKPSKASKEKPPTEPYLEGRMQVTTPIDNEIVEAGKTFKTKKPQVIKDVMSSGRLAWFRRYDFVNGAITLVESKG